MSPLWRRSQGSSATRASPRSESRPPHGGFPAGPRGEKRRERSRRNEGKEIELGPETGPESECENGRARKIQPAPGGPEQAEQDRRSQRKRERVVRPAACKNSEAGKECASRGSSKRFRARQNARQREIDDRDRRGREKRCKKAKRQESGSNGRAGIHPAQTGGEEVGKRRLLTLVIRSADAAVFRGRPQCLRADPLPLDVGHPRESSPGRPPRCRERQKRARAKERSRHGALSGSRGMARSREKCGVPGMVQLVEWIAEGKSESEKDRPRGEEGRDQRKRDRRSCPLQNSGHFANAATTSEWLMRPSRSISRISAALQPRRSRCPRRGRTTAPRPAGSRARRTCGNGSTGSPGFGCTNAEALPRVGGVARLLEQLAPGGVEGRAVPAVDRASRDLERERLGAVPVLLDEDDALRPASAGSR